MEGMLCGGLPVQWSLITEALGLDTVTELCIRAGVLQAVPQPYQHC